MNLNSDVMSIIINNLAFEDVIQFRCVNTEIKAIVDEHIKYINKDNLRLIKFKNDCKMNIMDHYANRTRYIVNINTINGTYHGICSEHNNDFYMIYLYDNGILIRYIELYGLKLRIVTNTKYILLYLTTNFDIGLLYSLDENNYRNVIEQWCDLHNIIRPKPAEYHMSNTLFRQFNLSDYCINIYKQNMN